MNIKFDNLKLLIELYPSALILWDDSQYWYKYILNDFNGYCARNYKFANQASLQDLAQAIKVQRRIEYYIESNEPISKTNTLINYSFNIGINDNNGYYWARYVI